MVFPLVRVQVQEIVMLKRQALLVVATLAAVVGSAGSAAADEVVNGTLGPGALYRLVRPTSWNGSLVVYAHGFVSADAPVAIPPDAEQVIALLAPQGFAVAVSSFSQNGWAVKDGTQRTHQLLGIFTSKFGVPTRVYAAGGSMGGLIAIALVEKFPGKFSGLLPACAVAGGLRPQLDYFGNVRVLFDLFYPGVLPGSVVDVPAGIDVTSQIVLPATAAMTADLSGALAISTIAQTPVPFASGPELVQSIVTALAAAAAYPDVLALTHGQPFFDNSQTEYTGALPAPILQWINANVERYAASPAGVHYIEHHYTPSGQLSVPALTLSTFRDPVAPQFHRDLYGAAVAAAGNGDWLVQRSVAGAANGYGHCTFTPQELSTAFFDLVLWVEFGVKPAP
jgi:pimeloyl-ACP methyl ester carboxylesterase